MGEHRRKADGRRVFSTEFKRTTVQRILSAPALATRSALPILATTRSTCRGPITACRDPLRYWYLYGSRFGLRGPVSCERSTEKAFAVAPHDRHRADSL